MSMHSRQRRYILGDLIIGKMEDKVLSCVLFFWNHCLENGIISKRFVDASIHCHVLYWTCRQLAGRIMSFGFLLRSVLPGFDSHSHTVCVSVCSLHSKTTIIVLSIQSSKALDNEPIWRR